MKVKTRMAPSPTGNYHLGHIRTVLYDYAYAKKHNGTFLIRIEDTDKEREVEGAVESILSDLKAYNLMWDEGPEVGGEYGPYFQSERLDIYAEYAQKLVDEKKAYPCFCSKERLTELRDAQKEQKLPPKYDKHCLNLSPEEVRNKIEAGEPYVIRLNVPQNENITFKDEIYGEITINSNDVDDQVLLKSDNYPTYHMAVVIDDYLMQVTHVLRGNDWLPSTPKHILLYKAFGWEPPVYAHLPNLKEKGGPKKLSKRFGSVFVRQFLEEGYLPEAVLNFLMLLGWNPGNDREIYSLEEFVEAFDINRIHKTDLVAVDRDKLLWYNGYYIRAMATAPLLERIKAYYSVYKPDILLDNLLKDFSSEYVLKALEQVQERMHYLSEFDVLTSFYFQDPKLDSALLIKFAKEQTAEVLKLYIDALKACDDWSVESLETLCRDIQQRNDLKPKTAFMTLRVALTNQEATPPLFDMMSLFGKAKVLDRLNSAFNLLS